MSDDLVADAMLPSHERLVEIHRRLDPPGTSLILVEQLIENLLSRADELQSDLELRDAALARSLALLRFAYDLPTIVRIRICQRVGVEPAAGDSWPDVLRWVSDEPKEENVDRYGEIDETETPQATEAGRTDDPAAAGAHADDMVDHYAGSLSDVDWRSAEESRWSAFSDEELQALAEMTSLCSTSEPLASARRAMAQEVAIVRAWREAEQPTYRGPGRYLSIVGPTYEVLGVLGDLVIVRDPTRAPGALVSVTRRSFEARGEGGKRLYEYLGPLEGS